MKKPMNGKAAAELGDYKHGSTGVGSANLWGGKKTGRSSLLCSQAPEEVHQGLSEC